MTKKNLVFGFRKWSSKNKETVKNNTYVSYLQMFRYATKFDKWLIGLGLISTAITGILRPVYSILIGDLIGDFITYAKFTISINNSTTLEEKTEADEKLFIGIIYFCGISSLIGLGMFVFNYIAITTFNYSSIRQLFRIRSEYLKSILNQDISWYDTAKKGDFASRMSGDMYKLEDGIGEKVPMFLHIQVLFISSNIIALMKGWKLALVSLLPLPLLLIITWLVNSVTIKLASIEMDAYGTAGSIAEEVFSLIKTVTAFGGQQKEVDRYKKNLVTAKTNNIKRSAFTGIGAGSTQLFIFCSNALAYWYGVTLLLEENTTYTTANVITILFCRIIGSVNFAQSSPYLEVFGMAKAAATKIFNIIDNEPIINLSKQKGNVLTSFQGTIEFKNVKFHYPSRPRLSILQGINFKIKSGEKVAIVGMSGCGKSTIIQLIQRFYDTTSGEVLINGNNIKDLNLKWLRSNIGVVGQEPILFSISIMENIKYGKYEVTDEEVIAAAKKANAHKFIKSLSNGYSTLVGERGTQLSGGQKQRIAIARALVRNPAILLLDEATSALDNTSEAKVQEALDQASVNCTTVIVAHRLSTIRSADKIIVLSQGVVVEEGNHNELMELKKEYYKLVTSQLPCDEIVNSCGKEINNYENKDEDILLHTSSKDNLVEDDDFTTDANVTLFEVIKMNGPEWPFILIASIGSIVVGCGLPVYSVISGNILGELSNADSEYLKAEVNKYCICFVITGWILMVSAFLQNYLLGIAGERMTERIRTRLFEAIVLQEMSFFDKKSNGVGKLCAKLSGDATSIQGATGQRIGIILQSLSISVVALGISIYYEWKLTLVTIAFTPLIFVCAFMEKRKTRSKGGSSDKALQYSTKVAQEAVANIRTVAALALEEKFLHNYISELKPLYKASLQSVHWRGILYGLATSLTFFGYAAGLYYGGFLIKDGFPYDKVILIVQSQMMGSMAIANILAFCPNLTNGLNAAKNVKSFLSKAHLIKNVFVPHDLTQVKGTIKYSNVQFSYPARSNIAVLKGLTLKIPNGKTVALVGESGCGKSTIIQLLERFYDPNSGEMYLDNNDIKNISPAILRSHLSIVSQEPNLFNKTITENIAYGDNSRDVTMNEIMQAAKSANIHNFIIGLPDGYCTKLGEKATQLSGGQKQRIAIARALLRNPKVLLLDEATSALDCESEKIVQDALDRAKNGRTCITIAHRLTTIQDADLICVVDGGIIVESGTHNELLETKGFYHRLYSQNRLIN